MFILKSKEQLTKAIENAKALHPKVKMIEFGEYEVSNILPKVKTKYRSI